MNVCATFKAHSQPAVLVKPRDSALHHPTMNSQPATMLSITECKYSLYTPIAQPLNIGRRAIRPIALDPQRTFTRTSQILFDRRYGINQRQQLCRVVDLRSGEDAGKGHAAGVGDNVMLAAWFCSVCWIWATFFPHRPPLGWNPNQRLLVTSRSYWHTQARLRAHRATSPKHRLPASPEVDANMRHRYHNSSLWVASPTGWPR